MMPAGAEIPFRIKHIMKAVTYIIKPVLSSHSYNFNVVILIVQVYN